MTSQDWLLFLVILATVGFVAYALGARRRDGTPSGAAASPRADAEEKGARAEPKKKAKKAEAPAKAKAKPTAKTASTAEPDGVEDEDEDDEPAKDDEAAKGEPAPTKKSEPVKAAKDVKATPGKEDAPKADTAVAAKEETAKTAKEGAAVAAKEDAPKADTAVAAKEAAPKEGAEAHAVPKLFESDDEDVDVTRVGSLGVPPLRAIIQPPVILHDDEGASADEPAGAEPYFLVSATAQTDTGLRRKRNEDSLLVLREKNLFVVADGMGGHRGGETASRLAVKAIEDSFGTGTFEGKPHEGLPLDASELARAMQMANATILETAKAKPELEGMGTTLCCARFSPTKRRLHIGHVGDSRCYRLRDGHFTQLTKDHTMADLGLTGPESANLSRAVGIWSTVPIDIIVDAPSPDDVYLLCSDGLTKMLDDERIAHVLKSEEDAQAAVDRLIFFANAKGGKDNITVILIRVVTPAPAAAT